jgi:Na+/phosphate symporter
MQEPEDTGSGAYLAFSSALTVAALVGVALSFLVNPSLLLLLVLVPFGLFSSPASLVLVLSLVAIVANYRATLRTTGLSSRRRRNATLSFVGALLALVIAFFVTWFGFVP